MASGVAGGVAGLSGAMLSMCVLFSFSPGASVPRCLAVINVDMLVQHTVERSCYVSLQPHTTSLPTEKPSSVSYIRLPS